MLMNKIKSNIPLAIGAAVFIIGFWLVAAAGGSADAPTETQEKQERGELVEVYKVAEAVHSWNVTASGRLRALDNLSVVAEVAGKVAWMDDRMRTGGRFAAGETLFKIDATTYKNDVARADANLKAAQANFRKAQMDYDRAQMLFEKGNVSEATVDTATAARLSAEAQVSTANAALSTANEMLDRTVIKAPFDALIVDEMISLDSYVSPGQNLATLMGTKRAEMAISLQSHEVSAIARTYRENGGQPLMVTARPGNGAISSLEITGQIARISPIVDQKSRTATIIAEFDDVFTAEHAGQVFGDDFMSVDIEARSQGALWRVPYGAIRKGRFVWVIGTDNKMRMKPVTVMSTDGTDGIIATERSLAGKNIMLTLLPEEIEGKLVRIRDER